MESVLIFTFDPHLKKFSWPNKSKVDEFTKKTNMIPSELSTIIEEVNKIEYTSEKTQKLQDKIQYTFTIKLLILELLILLAFLILIIQKIYFYRNLALEIIAIPFACFGLALNLIIILKKGKINFSIFSKKQSSKTLDQAYRHKVFMVLNAFNKTNTYGLHWKILKKGKVIELGCLE